MHDAKGRELKVGDWVLIPAKIVECTGGEEFCNVSVETFHGRKPDGLKERLSAFNSAVMLRINAGDLNNTADFRDLELKGKKKKATVDPVA